MGTANEGLARTELNFSMGTTMMRSMESETYTEVTSDAGERFFVRVLSDAWHVFAGEVAIGSDGADSCRR